MQINNNRHWQLGLLSPRAALVLALSLALLIGAAPSVAQTTAAKLVPVITLLLDGDDCISIIKPGDVVFDSLDPNCESEALNSIGEPGSYAHYFSFTHPGGPLHIDLISDFPNTYDTYLFLKEGEGRDGEVVAEDGAGHDDYRSSRIDETNLPAGRYTIEATTLFVSTSGNFSLSVYTDIVTAKATGKLNDTGIEFAGTSNSINSTSCDGTGNFENQDCSYGRDADSLIGYAEPDNDGDGESGFSYLKVSSSGAPLPGTAVAWNCVKDNVTGLMWEVKTNNPTTPDLHDKDHTYTWYNTNAIENGGAVGTPGGGMCFSGVVCDTEGYVTAVNSAGLCGYNDWRMPSVTELQGLVNYGRTGSMIDAGFFRPDTNQFFWSGSPSASFADGAWGVFFDSGFVSERGRSVGRSVRLVRGGQ